jgi:SRSO17 transposase
VADAKFRSPEDIIKQEPTGGWARYTYWYEVVRNGEEITLRYSYDGVNFKPAFTASLPAPVGAKQRVIIDGNVWDTAGSYVDWDYIHYTGVTASDKMTQ